MKVVDVTQRFSNTILFGLIVESCILLTVLAGLCMGRFTKTANLLGYTSLGWFVYLIFVRYDHFGKVCSGDFLEQGITNTYSNLATAAYFAQSYFTLVGLVVSALFLIVLMYSCCIDSGKKSTDGDEDQDM